jgi:ComF family protein
MGAGWVQRWMSAGVDVVLPPRCLACGEIVDADSSFCAPCWMTLAPVTAPFCEECGTPFELAGSGPRCGACIAEPPRYRARAAYAYEGAARDVVLALKHGDRLHLAPAMATALRRAAPQAIADPDAVIVPVPLHRWRLWRRGYNQSAELARALAAATRLPLAVDALVRVRATKVSAGLSPKARRRNLAGAFRVPPARRPLVANRPVVLVDDVYTTGATADACARALLRGGAKSVDLVAWARVVRPEADVHSRR